MGLGTVGDSGNIHKIHKDNTKKKKKSEHTHVCTSVGCEYMRVVYSCVSRILNKIHATMFDHPINMAFTEGG